MPRLGTKQDLQALTTLLQTVFCKPPYNEEADQQAIHESLAFYYDNGTILLAEEDNELQGAIILTYEQWWQGKTALIQDLAVAEKNRGRGIGEALLQAAEKHAREEHAKLITLTTHAKGPIEYYQKHGYKQENTINLQKQL